MENETQKQNNIDNPRHIINAGVTSQSRNRLRTALAEVYARATNGCNWTLAMNVTEITFMCTATDARSSAATADVPNPNDNYYLLAYNAVSEGIAGSMLTEADSSSDDVQHEKFLFGKEYTRRFTTPLLFLDVKPVNVSTTLSAFRLFVGAH